MDFKSQFQVIALNLAFITLIAFALTLGLWNFKKYGDFFQIALPALCVVLPLYQKDFQKLKQLIFAILASTLITHLCKISIPYLVAEHGMREIFSFAQRPINMMRFDGFPSGHTQGAFIGFAFAFVYFKMRWKILFFCLALMVGISRIYSGYHTILQVICGALVGFFVSYLMIRFLQKHNS